MVKKIVPLVILFILIFPAVFPLLHSGFMPTHDGEYHIIRFYEFHKSLIEGVLYPRWAADLQFGYGVPLFNYVYPLPNYIASFLYIFTYSFIDAFKWEMIFATLVGSLFVYLWSKQYWGTLAGVVSAVFYAYAPYHILDVYVRGSVGEVWALAFFPAVLWATAALIHNQKKPYLILIAIFFSFTIFSHNILAVMFCGFYLAFLLYLLCIQRKMKLVLQLFLSLVVGIGMVAIFWLPALFEQKYVTGLQLFDVQKNFAQLYQLLIPSWGTGIFGSGLQNEMSIQIGITNLMAVVISLTIYIIRKIKRKPTGLLGFFLISYFVVFFLMQRVSSPIWSFFPLMNFFQFPWRFLSLEILITAFLAGGIISFIPKLKILNVKLSVILAVFLICIAIFSSIGYTMPAYYHNRTDSHYLSRSNFIDGTNSPGNYFNTIWAKGKFQKTKNPVSVSQGKVTITSFDKKTHEWKIAAILTQDSTVTAYLVYFPGWSLSINGVSKPIHPTEKGLISFAGQKGQNNIRIQYQNTPIQLIGTSITFFSLLGLVLLWYSKKICSSFVRRLANYGRVMPPKHI